MNILKKLTGFLLLFFGLGFSVLTCMTLLPATASKPNLLGYYSICSYSPISSLILMGLVGIFTAFGLKMLRNPICNPVFDLSPQMLSRIDRV